MIAIPSITRNPIQSKIPFYCDHLPQLEKGFCVHLTYEANCLEGKLLTSVHLEQRSAIFFCKEPDSY